MSAAANLFALKYHKPFTGNHLCISQNLTQVPSGIRSYNSKNHYEALDLKQSCSQEEIRESFVRLSKLHHPDSAKRCGSGGTGRAARFTEIMEAYKVLGKPDMRKAYDQSLQFNYPFERTVRVEYDGQVFRPNAKDNYGFPDPKNTPGKGPYYGINAIKGKLSNKVIVACCFVFAGIGIFTQILAIRHSFTFRRDRLEEKSAEISKSHAEVRAEAERNGNQLQIEKLKSRLLAGRSVTD